MIDNLNELDELLSVIFVVYGDQGARVLFRYPPGVDNRNEDSSQPTGIMEIDEVRRKETSIPILSETCPRKHLNSLYDTSLASLLVPKKTELCNKHFHVEIDHLVCIGHPFEVERTKRIYNIVFIVSKDASTHIIDSLYYLSVRISIALNYEEQQCGYISESEGMMEHYYAQDDVTVKDNIDPHELQEGIIVRENCPFVKMVVDVPVAQNLKAVFDSVKQKMFAKVLINKTINFSFFIEPERNMNYEVRTKVAPYESFVLLGDPGQIREGLNLDSSPSLLKLLQVDRPYLRKIKDIAMHLDIDYDEIKEAVLALVRWRKALIVYPLVHTNEYMLSDNIPESHYPAFEKQFHKKFPGYDFYKQLSKFSDRRVLSDCFDPFKETMDERNEVTAIVAWLLSKRLLVQLFAHVYLQPPPIPDFQIRAPSRSSSIVVETISGSESDETISNQSFSMESETKKSYSSSSLIRGISLSETKREQLLHKYLNRTQRQDLSTMCSQDKGRSECRRLLNDFAGVLPYASSGKHMEEILWEANMDRRDLTILIDIFSAFLLTIKHPA